MNKLFHLLAVLGTALALLATALFFKQSPLPLLIDGRANGLLVQNTYMGPTKKIPGNPQFVRVEVLVSDSPEAAGVQIQEVQFDGNSVPLKTRDIYGNRGGASFQKAPGTYKLRWVVNRTKYAWPRNTTHEEIVTISPRDLWIQIEIVGEKASIR